MRKIQIFGLPIIFACMALCLLVYVSEAEQNLRRTDAIGALNQQHWFAYELTSLSLLANSKDEHVGETEASIRDGLHRTYPFVDVHSIDRIVSDAKNGNAQGAVLRMEFATRDQKESQRPSGSVLDQVLSWAGVVPPLLHIPLLWFAIALAMVVGFSFGSANRRFLD